MQWLDSLQNETQNHTPAQAKTRGAIFFNGLCNDAGATMFRLYQFSLDPLIPRQREVPSPLTGGAVFHLSLN